MVQSSNDSEPSSPTLEWPKMCLSPGLLGQDDNFDKLSALWEQLQMCTIETADPALDLMTFAENAYYFAIIMLESKTEVKKAVSWYTYSQAMQTPNAGKFWAFQPSMPSTSFAPPPEYSYYDKWEFATTREAIGMVYLTVTPCTSTHSPPGELNIGIILEERARRRGYGSEVVRQMLVKAFDEGNFHRVQASLVHALNKDAAMTMYTQLKFNHEGTRRRSFYSPFETEWKDVTCLALLDTDWINRPFLHPAPKSLWDEMFARHAREREELLRWEDNQKRLKRTASMETIMPGGIVDGHSVSGNESDYQSATESESDAEDCGNPRRYPSVSEGSDVDSDFDETHSRVNLLTRRPSPALSYASSDDHSWRSLSPAPVILSALAHSPSSRAVTPALSEHSVASVPETDVSMSDGDFSSWDTDFGTEDDHSDAEHHF
ncbi:hypothetical protein PLEOSDRAFT_1109506 [Pleurotus ostreatus PC15]|uniref:N-acetyltransferase domain-containing protein n=1 Tax=Pleurotus ostreatus (strain PC15) TaxID=1137138 RepID=A0A067N620_PLEO1|nr:hypothetical protein PLEOSDRAFT_1109506 [Pleurotus ostreatus PC15]